jgi:hypothetical protein
VRGVLIAVVAFFALVAPAWAGGPYMMIGAAEDLAKQPTEAAAKVEMDKAKLAGLDAIRVTVTWKTGERSLPASDATGLTNAIDAAQFTGIRILLSIYPYGSSVTPLTPDAQADFAAFAADVAKTYPYVHDFIVGNEPNLNRFWLPQFAPDGSDAAAPAFEQLLATTYDAIKAVRSHSTVYGVALSPRGADKPGTIRPTHSPTAFITDLGAAYRASGRTTPIMDAFAFHPYPENSNIGPALLHPYSTSLGIADYPKLVSLLGTAFDGTAQRGTSLPILYDEFGIESQIPAAKASAYTGTEPVTTHPVPEQEQAAFYQQAMGMAFCQKTVLGMLLFHVQDEKDLAAWQSGVYYADGTPKTSLYPVRAGASGVHRGVAAKCDGMKLTPKATLLKPHTVRGGVAFTLTSDLDARYVLRLDGAHTLRGAIVGGTKAALLFRTHAAKGPHTITGKATAAQNTGPPRTLRLRFTL